MPSFGLCDNCRHQRLIRSGKGSIFSMCERGLSDERFPKYPPVPVYRCPGWEESLQESSKHSEPSTPS